MILYRILNALITLRSKCDDVVSCTSFQCSWHLNCNDMTYDVPYGMSSYLCRNNGKSPIVWQFRAFASHLRAFIIVRVMKGSSHFHLHYFREIASFLKLSHFYRTFIVTVVSRWWQNRKRSSNGQQGSTKHKLSRRYLVHGRDSSS